VFPSFRFLRPPSCTLSVFLNNTYIINLTGCAYLILLCSKYYKTKQKYAMKINLKVPSKKKMKITKERKKSSSNRMLDQMCLKKLKKRLYFERSIFVPLPYAIKLRNFAPNNLFFWSDCNKMRSESVSGFCQNLYLL